MKKVFLKSLEEPSKSANAGKEGGGDTEGVGGRDQHEAGDQIHSSAICHQDLEGQASSSSSGRSENPDGETGSGDIGVMEGEGQQQSGAKVHSNRIYISQDFEEQDSSISSRRSENVAAQPEEM